MIDWNNPNVIRGFTLAAYTSFGVALWEFLLTLKFDLELLCRKRKLTLGTFLYMLCRYSNVLTACMFLVATNATRATRCELWIWIQFGASSFATNVATGLLYARVWALSNSDPFVVWGIGLPYVGAWGVIIYSTYMSDGQYIAALSTCSSSNLEAHRVATIYQLAVDLLCLAVMLILLVRMHRNGLSSLWRFLMQQGVIYFVAICLVYIFDLVCTSLPLSKAIALVPSLLRRGHFIAATRMQRGLIEFVENRSVVTSSANGSTRVTLGRTRAGKPQGEGTAVDHWIHDEDLKRIESGEHRGMAS
ncbi:hypothetical protein BKA62DRAFT_458483 [Auriculariales sp. MPI-PUGE-AT-0066]|nr:hypothetical protein BKA62DRAFT_458483 [Auriculariales sp. MPI-PUGE-AT-0066]